MCVKRFKELKKEYFTLEELDSILKEIGLLGRRFRENEAKIVPCSTWNIGSHVVKTSTFFLPQNFWVNSSLATILRYESLESDWEEFTTKKLGETIKLPHVNKSHKEEFSWTREMRDIVNEIYNLDFEEFGYEPL